MNILNYFIEANISLVFFYALYVLFLRKETNFGFSRMFLLGAIGLSVAVPFLELGALAAIPSIGTVVPAYLLPELTIGSTAEQAQETSAFGQIYTHPLIWCYCAVAGLLLLRFLRRCARLVMIIRSAFMVAEIGRNKVLAVRESAAAFSVFRYILIGNPSTLSDDERDLIIRHEMVHVQRRHTWDILISELVCIVFWFNPASHAIKKKLRDVHEFQADEKASEGSDIRHYCSLLARISLQSAGFTLASHFNKSLTIKRINMMKTIKRKISPWKAALLVPAISGVLFLVACQDQVMSDISTVAANSSVALDVPAYVQDRYEQLSRENPASKYVIIEVQNGGMSRLNELEKQYGHTQSFEIIRTGKNSSHVVAKTAPGSGPAAGGIPVTLEKSNDHEARTFAIVEFTDQVQALSNSMVQEGEIFLVVEKTAFPKEGMEKLWAFLVENMSYPAEAKEKGISGRVFIEFVVEKDGTLTNFKSLKGIGHGCDEEAIRVLALSPAWVPALQEGKPVRQKMVIPVVFNL